MLEIHLFVNPLGMRCFRCEQDVLRIDQQLRTKVNYQFIPLFNMDTIQQTMKLYHLNDHDLNVRQQTSATLYQIILDYKAALFQGRKRGRHYLLRLQSALIHEGADYSEALAQKIAQQAQLDLDMFWEDRKSELAIKAFKKDQYMADEMGVTQTATAVVFDSEQPVYGYMINNFDYESLIESYRNHQFCLQQTPEEFAQSFNDKHHQSTLRIL